MDESLLQVCRINAVLLCCKSNEAVVVYINSEGVEGGHQHVHTQVVLESVYQVRHCYVLRREVSVLATDLGLFANDLDPSSAAGRHGLEYIQDIVVLSFAIKQELIVVCGEQIGGRSDVELFAKLVAHSVHVLPQQVLAAQLDRPWEMVNFLVFVHLADLLVLGVAGPDHVPVVGLLDHLEASVFEPVDHCVVDVR